MSKPIRVVIADHDLNFTLQLKSFLDQQSDIAVVNTVRDGLGAVKAWQELWPDVAIMDLRLPVVDTVRAVQSILEKNDLAKILVVSSIHDDRYAIEAIKFGACGFVVKNGPGTYNEIACAIRKVTGGEVVLNSSLASHILREFSQGI